MGAHLGPWPEATVAMFEDLGLTEAEIARHLRIDPARVRQLRARAAMPGALPPWIDPADPPSDPAPDPPDPPRGRLCARLRSLIDRLCRR